MKREVAAAAVATTAATVVVVALLMQWKQRCNEQRQRNAQQILRKFARECATPVAKLWHIANDLVSQMQAGETAGDSILPMFPSYQEPLPTGEETGTYYGISFQGTSFVMVRARLGGKNEPVSEPLRQEVEIPSTNSTKELFDFMSLELAKFISINEDSDEARLTERKLGLTVAFPVDQAKTISPGVHFKPKDLSLDSTVGMALKNEINEALASNAIQMRVFSLVNETVGNLAGGRYYSRENVAAVSLGMGTNVSYIESATQPADLESKASAETIVNMQWGEFKSSHLPITEFDESLDGESTNPGDGTFEKLVSGMYLGEIVRRVLLLMAKEAALFGNTTPPKLSIPYLLRTPDMAAMQQDTSEDYETVDEKLRDVFEISNSSVMARKIVAEVCDMVVERGARLVGAGIVGIVKKLGRIANKKSVITLEGGLYEHYRIFRNYLHSSVWEMLGSQLSDNVIIEPCHGGSGAGSIFLAASQSQSQTSRNEVI